VVSDLGHPNAAGIAPGRIYRELLSQSTILAYSDAFQFVSFVLFALVIVALMMPGNKPQAKAPAAAAAH
jgi:hypothetical protein